MNQMSLFDYTMDRYQIQNKIRLIPLFSGVDFQSMALRDLGLDFEIYKTCEWDIHPMASAKAIHFANDDTDYSSELDKDTMINKLFDYGISNDGKKPMEQKQIKRLNEKSLRNIYNNIKATKNLVNITKVHANDLNIVDKDKYCYIVTYSFPCQDLSKAGKQKGMAKGSGTRSEMLWEVERILNELKKNDNLPNVLLMENVPDVAGKKNIKFFNEWKYALEILGYTNHVMMLNAKNFSIPQNRNRCYMVSILGSYNYIVPKKTDLEFRLKDLLEENVDEKYYLSQSKMEHFEKSCEDKELKILGNVNPSRNGINGNVYGTEIAPTITTNKGEGIKVMVEGVMCGGKWDKTHEICRRVYSTNGISNSITAMCGGNQEPKIIEPVICASRGRNPDNPKSRKSGLDTVQMIEINDSGCSNTITTVQKDNLVVIPAIYQRSRGNNKGGKKELCPSITCNSLQENNFVLENADGVYTNVSKEFDRGTLDGMSRCIKANNHDAGVIINNRIRKLTPLECWRLMGANDDDFYRAKKVNSNSQLYKQAGNGIVKQVLMAIFGQLIPSDYKFRK